VYLGSSRDFHRRCRVDCCPPTAASLSLANTTRRHSLASVSTTEDAVPAPRRREQQFDDGPQSRTKFDRKGTRFPLTSRGASRLPPNGHVRWSTQYWLSDAYIWSDLPASVLAPQPPFPTGSFLARLAMLIAGAERGAPSVCPTPLPTLVRGCSKPRCWVLTDTVSGISTANDSRDVCTRGSKSDSRGTVNSERTHSQAPITQADTRTGARCHTHLVLSILLSAREPACRPHLNFEIARKKRAVRLDSFSSGVFRRRDGFGPRLKLYSHVN
jgi:hypothetical protein